MKLNRLLALVTVLFLSSFALMACKNVDTGRAVSAVADAYKAETLSEGDAIDMGKLVAEESDSKNKVSAANSKYSQRLAMLTKDLKNEDGLDLNFKVYEVSDINAFALPDGSIRVFSSLMDIMEDDELFFIIGHEIGHVKNKDSFNRMRAAYRLSAARKAAGAAHGVAAALTDSQLGDLAEQFVNAQYSQSQESSADLYGAQMMKKYNKPIAAGASSLRKLGEGGGGALSSHPNTEERAKKIESL